MREITHISKSEVAIVIFSLMCQASWMSTRLTYERKKERKEERKRKEGKRKGGGGREGEASAPLALVVHGALKSRNLCTIKTLLKREEGRKGGRERRKKKKEEERRSTLN